MSDAGIPEPSGPQGRTPEPRTPSNPFGEPQAAAKARRSRNLAIALGLVAFVVLVFVVTLLKLGSGHG